MSPFPVIVTGKAEGKVIATGHTFFPAKRYAPGFSTLSKRWFGFYPREKEKKKKRGEGRGGEREGWKMKNTSVPSVLLLPGEISTYSKDVNENCAYQRCRMRCYFKMKFYIWFLPVHGNNTRCMWYSGRVHFSLAYHRLNVCALYILVSLRIYPFPRRCSRISALLQYDSFRVCSTIARSLFRKARRGNHFDAEIGISHISGWQCLLLTYLLLT